MLSCKISSFVVKMLNRTVVYMLLNPPYFLEGYLMKGKCGSVKNFYARNLQQNIIKFAKQHLKKWEKAKTKKTPSH